MMEEATKELAERSALPEGWRWVKLGKVCGSVSNYDPSRDAAKEFTYVDISSIDNETKAIVNPKKLLGKEAPSRARQVIRVGDVLVSTTRPNLNAVAQVSQELDGQIASTGFCVLRPIPGELDSTYLFGFVRSDVFVQALSDLVQGALYPAVTDKQVFAQLIPLPSYEEQLQIAERLREQLATVNEARAAAEAQLQTLNALPAALLREAFSGKVQRNVGGGQFDLGEDAIPAGWRWVTLGDLANAVRGVTFSSSQGSYTETPDAVACLTTSGVQEATAWDTRRFIPASLASDVQLLRPGDLLVSTANSKALVGKSCLVEEVPYKCTFGAFVTVLRPKPGVDPYYVSYLMRTSEALAYWYEKSSNTTNISNLRTNDMLGYPVPLPSLDEQRRITARLRQQLAAADEVRTAAESELASLRALPAALLRQSFQPTVA